MPHPLTRFLLAALLLAIPVAWPLCTHAEGGGEWALELKTKDEEKVSEDAENITVYSRTRERALDLTFDTFLQPEFELASKLSFSRKIDESSDDFDSTEDTVETEVTFTAQWWSLMLGFAQTDTTSDDPENELESTHTIDGELKITPEYEDLPELSYKFESTEDADTQNYTANLEYEIAKMLMLKVEATKDLTDNNGRDTENTDSRKFKGEASLKRDFWSMWQFEATASHTREQQLSLDNGGYLIEKQDKITNEYLTKLANNPLEWIDYSIEYKLTENEDLMEPLPVERTGNVKNTIKLSPQPTESLSFELGYINEYEDSSGLDTASRKYNNEYNFAAKLEALEFLTLDATYDRKDNQESPKSEDEASTSSRDDTYKVAADMGIWEDQFTLKIEREYKYSWIDSELTTEENTWNLEADITWDNIPNLELKPSYTFKNNRDEVEGTSDSEATIESNMIYTVSLGDVTEVKLDHTYKRIDTEPVENTPSILKREDNTTFSINFSDFLIGMNAEASWERTATDESLDDVGPETDYKYALKYDWDIIGHYKLTTEYEFSDNQESEDEERYKAELASTIFMEQLDIKVSYEKSQKFGAAGTIEQTYLIEVSGKL